MKKKLEVLFTIFFPNHINIISDENSIKGFIPNSTVSGNIRVDDTILSIWEFEEETQLERVLVYTTISKLKQFSNIF